MTNDAHCVHRAKARGYYIHRVLGVRSPHLKPHTSHLSSLHQHRLPGIGDAAVLDQELGNTMQEDAIVTMR